MKKYLWLIILPLLLFIPKNTFASEISSYGYWGGYLSSYGRNQSDSSDVIHISTEWVGSYDISTSSSYLTMPKSTVYIKSTAGISTYYNRYYYLSEYRMFAYASYQQGYYYTLNFEFNVGSYVQVSTDAMKRNVSVKMFDGSDYTIDATSVSVDATFNTGTAVGYLSVTFLAPASASHLRVNIGSTGLTTSSILALNGQSTYDQGFRVYLINVEETTDLSNALLAQITTQNQTIINQNQQIIDNSNKTNDLLEDDDVSGAEDSASGFFNDFESDDFGLSSIITMPLEFIKGLSSSTCYSLNLPLPFVDTNVTLPCMTSIYQKYFGDFFTLYQTITTGFIAYGVCINIFKLVQDFKSPDNDVVEVMEL